MRHGPLLYHKLIMTLRLLHPMHLRRLEEDASLPISKQQPHMQHPP